MRLPECGSPPILSNLSLDSHPTLMFICASGPYQTCQLSPSASQTSHSGSGTSQVVSRYVITPEARTEFCSQAGADLLSRVWPEAGDRCVAAKAEGPGGSASPVCPSNVALFFRGSLNLDLRHVATTIAKPASDS